MNINWDLNINPNNSGLWKMKKTQPYHVTPGQEKSAQDDHVAHKTKTVFFKAPRLGLGKKHETTMHTYRTLLKYWNQGVVELMMFLILGSYCINDTYIYIHYCVYIYIVVFFPWYGILHVCGSWETTVTMVDSVIIVQVIGHEIM